VRTVLEIEPDLYAAAERLTQAENKSLGQVVSDLLRRALGPGPAAEDLALLEKRNGFEVFPERPGPKATIDDVRQLCRDEGL